MPGRAGSAPELRIQDVAGARLHGDQADLHLVRAARRGVEARADRRPLHDRDQVALPAGRPARSRLGALRAAADVDAVARLRARPGSAARRACAAAPGGAAETGARTALLHVASCLQRGSAPAS